MSDSERIADLERKVEVLMAERAATAGIVLLVASLITVLERDRNQLSPSIIDSLDNAMVAQAMAVAPGTLPPDFEKAGNFVNSVLEGLQQVRARAESQGRAS